MSLRSSDCDRAGWTGTFLVMAYQDETRLMLVGHRAVDWDTDKNYSNPFQYDKIVFFSCLVYRKNPKKSYTRKISVIILKFEKCGFNTFTARPLKKPISQCQACFIATIIIYYSPTLKKWGYTGFALSFRNSVVLSFCRNSDETWISLRTADQCWSNFIWSIIRVGERLHKVSGQIGSKLLFPCQQKVPIDL